MFFEFAQREKDFQIFALRRKDLIHAIKQKNPSITHGVVLLFGNFEYDRHQFRQDSSFYYYTGISEPGLVLVLDLQGKSVLYVPCHDESRASWVKSLTDISLQNAKKLGLDEIMILGKQCSSYHFGPLSPEPNYETFLLRIRHLIENKGTIFALDPNNPYDHIEQRFMLNRIINFIPAMSTHVQDISSLVARMRQIKDMQEIELIHNAVAITIMAHEAASQAIRHDVLEAEVQASLEFIMTSSGAKMAFPSIVASGVHGTILHYNHNSGTLKNGELVVVDIGAEYNGYCADLTRTYPVSGQFSARQKELYQIVLDTQNYIADLARPGLWLSNKEKPEQSLNHLAKEYIRKKGYGEYFIHNIGHYLGLDVHDVGDYSQPLQEGDVITIEPGIYIPREKIGIRIEDNYWIVKDGAICLSESLPKESDDIEYMMQTSIEEHSNPLNDDMLETAEPEIEN